MNPCENSTEVCVDTANGARCFPKASCDHAGYPDCTNIEECFNSTGNFTCKTILQQAVEEQVPPFITYLLSEDVYMDIMLDSPDGFVHGNASYETVSIENTTNTFEASGSKVTVSGVFVPEDTSLSWPITARVYSYLGRAGAASVNPEDGHFSVVITDIPLGLNPYFLTFTSGSTNRRRLEVLPVELPKLIWCLNQECASPLTFKLTWKSAGRPGEGTSDLDLHVWEPGEEGEHVYYSHDVGHYCTLDEDDRDGFGPEHIVCNGYPEGLAFKTNVCLFDEDQDTPPFQYQLEVFNEGKLFHIEAGSLPSEGQEPDEHCSVHSPMFEVTPPPHQEQDACYDCVVPSPPAGFGSTNSLEVVGKGKGKGSHRKLLADNECEKCEPEMWICVRHWYNYLPLTIQPWLFFYCEWKISESWKVYNDIVNLSGNDEQMMAEIRYYLNLLLLPSDGLGGLLSGPYDHTALLDTIAINKSRLQPRHCQCFKKGLLNAFCAINKMSVASKWISYIGLVKGTQFTALSSTELTKRILLKTLPDYATQIFRAFVALDKLPGIGKVLINVFDLCTVDIQYN